MMSAFIAVPLTFFAFRIDGTPGSPDFISQAVLQVFETALFVVLTIYTKKLLNEQFGFHDADRSLALMIMANIGSGVLMLTGLAVTPLKETLGIAALVIMVFQGLVQTQFGYNLRNLQNDLNGLQKPFCYANMLTGICIASVVLIIVGVVVSAISDLMLGTIFLNIAKQVKGAEAD
jgi:hypothetical protein